MVINGEDFRIRYELESDGAKDKSIFVACKDSGENLARFWADVGEIDDGCHNFFNYDALRITPHSDLYELINPTFLK